MDGKQEIIETEIAMGTVHSAAIEPYRVRLFVEDEIVRDAEITVGVNHRGIERIMEGLPVEKANSLTEKVCGICSGVHLWNSVLVAEKGLGVEIPERASYIRIIVGELERLHSHLLYLAHGNEVLGHETFSMRLFYIRETVMELLRLIGGNRVFFCQAEDGIRDLIVTGVQTCALPILPRRVSIPHRKFKNGKEKAGRSFTGDVSIPHRKFKN